MHTNINLSDGSNKYMYILEYDDNGKSLITDLSYTFENANKINFLSIDSNIKRNGNNWMINYDDKFTDYIPDSYSTVNISLYFPSFSIEVYRNNIYYALTLNTWISGRELVLGTYIIKRMDAIAADRVMNFYNEKYYEKMDFEIISPWDMMYGDNWHDFRKYICKERQIDEDYALNSVGSVLNATLYPVEFNGTDYVMIDGFHGGQNSIKISNNLEDFFSLKLTTNCFDKNTTNQEPAFNCNLIFNNVYNDSLKDYIIETYNIDKYNIKYELVIGNDDNIYGVYESELLSNSDITSYKFGKSVISPSFINGYGWEEGISVKSSVDILDADGNSILYLLSNSVPLTRELFSYFVGMDSETNPEGYFIQCGYKINNVNLDKVDMHVYNINAVNKIEQKIVQLNRPENSKSNIVLPVFFKTRDLNDLILHPSVTETICINLDTFKSKVESFIIQIEGCDFKEIGRTNNGILFKIVGGSLPKQKHSGLYYILNQKSELISSGKYTYVL